MTNDKTVATDQTKEPLASVSTENFPQILSKLGISLAVSTYQAGKVILIRSESSGNTADPNSGAALNTHFRDFDKPMGIAALGDRLTIGGQKTVWELRNMPAVARKLEPAGKHDACYVPRSIHITGDIDIHEMCLGVSPDSKNDELWIVNTRFCCLCTLDIDHSFRPRWRPPFVSAYAPEDRCHLNGLALVDGRPKYVTALGETDSAGGWRENKASGGLIMDVESNEILVRGLSMPHSPRWYREQLFVLESGEGSLSVVDLEVARETCQQPGNKKVATRQLSSLPGFTRGIDFYGSLAFIGLSQVRESATFSDLPIIERLGEERTCGVWVVNIETGETVAFLRFESGVQEIFAVQVLPQTRYPEMLEWGDPKVAFSYVLPDEVMDEVPNVALS